QQSRVSGEQHSQRLRIRRGPSAGGFLSRIHENALRPADVGSDGDPLRDTRNVVCALTARHDYRGRHGPDTLHRESARAASISDGYAGAGERRIARYYRTGKPAARPVDAIIERAERARGTTRSRRTLR